MHKPLSRRKFLASSALWSGALLSPSVFGKTHETQISNVALQSLRRSLTGPLLKPGDQGFNELALPNNLRYRTIRPGAIALCLTPEDIAECLKWCSHTGVPLATRGGGHSYAGYSSTEGLMINLMNFNAASYNPQDATITVGGGIRNGSIYSALSKVNRSITHGHCPTVGAGGFLLGGGVGFDMRRHGIASDHLIATNVVLANGDIVTASANDHSDLFWAMRGGAGGNFGINTSFTLNTFPVDQIVEFQLGWSNVSNEFLEVYFKTFEAAPKELGSKVTLTPGLALEGQERPINVSVIGQYIGSSRDLKEILAPIYQQAPPNEEVIQLMAYWNASSYLSDAGTPDYYQERSRFVNGPMPNAMIQAMREWLTRWPNAQGSGSIKFFQLGHETNALKPTDTAFVHRQSQWLASIGITWTPGQTIPSRMLAHRWQDRFYRAITPLSGGGAYQNFPDPSLRDWATSYYGENLNRLMAIKAAVDPHQLFRYHQSIRPLK